MLSQLGSRRDVWMMRSPAFVATTVLVVIAIGFLVLAVSSTGPVSTSSEVFIPTLVFPETG